MDSTDKNSCKKRKEKQVKWNENTNPKQIKHILKFKNVLFF